LKRAKKEAAKTPLKDQPRPPFRPGQPPPKSGAGSVKRGEKVRAKFQDKLNRKNKKGKPKRFMGGKEIPNLPGSGPTPILSQPQSGAPKSGPGSAKRAAKQDSDPTQTLPKSGPGSQKRLDKQKSTPAGPAPAPRLNKKGKPKRFKRDKDGNPVERDQPDGPGTESTKKKSHRFHEAANKHGRQPNKTIDGLRQRAANLKAAGIKPGKRLKQQIQTQREILLRRKKKRKS